MRRGHNFFRTTALIRRQSGAVLLEVGLVLLVVGVLTVATFELQSAMRRRQLNKDTDHVLQAVDAAVRTFAVRQQRLPCPDEEGRGVEAALAGGGCSAWTGGVPYFSLGMDRPQLAQGRVLRYGVSGALSSAEPAPPFLTRARNASLAAAASDPFVAGVDNTGYFTACGAPAFQPAYALMWTPPDAAVPVLCFRESPDGAMGLLAVGRVEFLGWLQSASGR